MSSVEFNLGSRFTEISRENLSSEQPLTIVEKDVIYSESRSVAVKGDLRMFKSKVL